MKSLPVGLLLVLAMAAGALAVPTFQTEQPRTGEGASSNLADELPVGQRLAAAALADLGIVKAEMVEMPSLAEREAGAPVQSKVPAVKERQLTFPVSDDSPVQACVQLAESQPALWGRIDPTAFVISITAAENYNRRFARRKLELWTGQALMAIGINLDPTLGLTQVRLSDAKALFRDQAQLDLSRQQIAGLLEKDCNAIQVSIWWLERKLRKMAAKGQTPTVESLAQSYNGGSGFHASEFPYALVVRSAYDHLISQSQSAPAPGAEGIDVGGCVMMDRWARRIESEHYGAVRGGKLVILTRQELLDLLGPAAKVRYMVLASDRWKGAASEPLRTRVDALVGVRNGRWAKSVAVEPAVPDGQIAYGLCPALGLDDAIGLEHSDVLADGSVLAVFGRNGPVSISAQREIEFNTPADALQDPPAAPTQ